MELFPLWRPWRGNAVELVGRSRGVGLPVDWTNHNSAHVHPAVADHQVGRALHLVGCDDVEMK